jgi:hypothetical protein
MPLLTLHIETVADAEPPRSRRPAKRLVVRSSQRVSGREPHSEGMPLLGR